MRQSSSIGFRSSIRARRVHFETWGVAAFLAIPTGCLETGGALAVLQSDLSSLTPTAGMVPDSIARSTTRGSTDSTAVKPDSSLPGLFSDEYWRALGDLDLAASRIAARGEPEMAFADAVVFSIGA